MDFVQGETCKRNIFTIHDYNAMISMETDDEVTKEKNKILL